MQEIWKDIPNYEGYQVSNLGRIRTHNKITYTKKHGERHWKNRILKQYFDKKNKFYVVDLWSNGKSKHFLVHRLVAFTFYNKNIKNKCETVDHINGNRLDNRLENLEIVSLKENIQRSFKNGLHDTHIKKIKLQYKDCARPIYCYSMREASRILGHTDSYISNAIKKGKFENKYAYWEFVK